MIDKVYTILNAVTAITDEVTGIWIDTIPEGEQMPYIVISQIQGSPNETKNAASELDEQLFAITVYSEYPYDNSGIKGAYTLAELCRTSLDFYEGIVSGTTLFIKAQTTASGQQLTIPNFPMFGVDIEFTSYIKRTL